MKVSATALEILTILSAKDTGAFTLIDRILK
jgi:hypothetical protein